MAAGLSSCFSLPSFAPVVGVQRARGVPLRRRGDADLGRSRVVFRRLAGSEIRESHEMPGRPSSPTPRCHAMIAPSPRLPPLVQLPA